MKVKYLKFLSFLLLLIFLKATFAMADTTIVGTGDPNIDVPAVQAAVDAGGRVLLRGTFAFGEPDFTGIDPFDHSTWLDWEGYPQYRPHTFLGVVISKSAEVMGENAVIIGGYSPFYINAPLDADVKISDITLKLPTLNGIAVDYCGTAIIENVTINGVKSCYSARGGFRPLARYGFIMTSRFRCDPNQPPDVCDSVVPEPYKLADNITIKNCNFNLVGDTGMAEYADDDIDTTAMGISVGYGVGNQERPIDLLIENNIVRNTSMMGILVTDIAGTATIKDNICLIGNKVTYEGASAISAGQHQPFFIWANHPPEWATYNINGNTIQLLPATLTDNNPVPEGQFNYGIFLFGTNGSTLRKNTITSSNSNALFLYLAASNEAYVRQNKLSGVGTDSGIYLGYASDNVFKGNNLTGLDPSLPTYNLDGASANNTVKGFTGGCDRVINEPEVFNRSFTYYNDIDKIWIYSEYDLGSAGCANDSTCQSYPAEPNTFVKDINGGLNEYWIVWDWFTEEWRNYAIVRTDPMIVLTVSGIPVTIPTPNFYLTSDGQMGFPTPNPVTPILKNNFITGCN